MGTYLYLSDILQRTGLDISKVKLIRHSLNDVQFRKCYENGFVKEYTQVQKNDFANGYDYWVVFIGAKGTTARLDSCYQVIGSMPISKASIPDNFPCPEMFEEDTTYYSLEKVDLFNDLEGRLIIDWGNSARSWQQNASNEKTILAIQENPKYKFTGFENVILTYKELKEILDEPVVYDNWHTALSSVNAIYLIVDTDNGKQYVGSAYGAGGLLSRWKCYIDTKHGNNKQLIELMYNFPERFFAFQFTILQIIPQNATIDEVIALENLYKKKLLSKVFGMNDN